MPSKNSPFTVQQEGNFNQHNRVLECIIVDKVYDSCFQRECDPEFELTLPPGGPFTFLSARFGLGFIVPNTLSITPIVSRPNFARVRFAFRVPFTAVLRNDGVSPPVNIEIPGVVEFDKDIALYIPGSADEFSFSIVIETRSQVLRAEIIQGALVLAIGVFVIVKVVGKVQLMVQSTGFCPSPRECEEIAPEDICEDFLTQPLPPFFPPQFTDQNCNC